MTIQQFVQKAIEGGWSVDVLATIPAEVLTFKVTDTRVIWSIKLGKEEKSIVESSIAGTVLDPLAWQAVGKVEGWHECRKEGEVLVKHANHDCPYALGCDKVEISISRSEWLKNMHRMIDAVEEGKKPEEFIATL